MKSLRIYKSPANAICGLLSILTALCVVGALLSRHLHISRYSKAMLISGSTGFMLVALVASKMRPSRYGRFILIALMLCWLGDFLGPYGFTLGLIMFLLAHLSFLAAFWSRGIDAKKFLLVSAVFLPLSAGVFYWLYPFVPKDNQAAVFSYMLVITAMVIFAGGIRIRNSLIFSGAVLFYISDIFVARWRFVSSGSINAFFCYPLYYAACILFALSILTHVRQRDCSA